MRLTLSNSLALLTVITALTMTGCSDERVDPAAGVAKVNTDHYFFNEQTIQIFNPESGLSVDVDTFDTGENKLINLDTDLKKQGFEYMAYVKSNGVNHEVFLKAYEKGSAAPQRLIRTANHICGIYPRKAAADENIAGIDYSEVMTQDQYLVDVVTNDTSCDPLTSQYYEIDISYLKPRSAGDPFKVLSIQETSSAFVLGTMLRNFGSTIDPDTGKPIRWGHIGYDVLNNSIQLYSQTHKLLWASRIDEEVTRPHFFQATNELAIIHWDQKIYIRKIPELFGLGRLQNSDGGELPSDSVIATFFATADLTDLTTDSANASNQVSIRKDNNNFILKDGRRLLYYNSQNNGGFSHIYDASSNVSDFEFSVLGGLPSQVIINATVTDETNLPNHKNLLALNSRTLVDITLASATEIQYRTIGDTLYVNTFKEADSNSWQAHRIVTPVHLEQSKTTYALSMFAFAWDYRKNITHPLMLRSNNSSSNGALITPEVGSFSHPNPETGLSPTKTFGVINYDVLIANDATSPDFVLNDIFGGLFIQSDDDDAQHMFFFNLNEAKDSLKQMY